ncbi:energy-coupling factor transport system ATP-binding protein [Ruminiclostridium sufflavum DSM 19573]|uniref:Energy-coupling factor transport system ATP-binding protein n=1 Tax=Ruminiclostridium sufflavum DSM 19573 TaxID=1121337 RepID=A0A318XXY5_9FIRM|nr:ABC transporter ATP-binding protein [Ruminiclostridium sufflavum]PYG87647.1 energy-coupling factor transport system ATP-binding protein [Ruminiclostridium sufflavum DSM 19573]
MIKFSNVCFAYDKANILENVSFTIEKGEFVAIVGRNGAGKTTLMKLFNGLLKPTSGNVSVSNLDTRLSKTSELARHVGFLFQNPDRQICRNTVKDEIAFGLNCVLDNKSEIEKRCRETIESFGFSGQKDPFSLSRGERQKVALASIIALSPEILVLDEPTTGLDYKECMHIMNIIKELNRSGTTVIMVCHDMELVSDFARRVIVIGDGGILADDMCKKVMLNSAVLARASLAPPQIAELAIRLGDDFGGILTIDEMTDKIESRCLQ